jgi:hypothetical protein
VDPIELAAALIVGVLLLRVYRWEPLARFDETHLRLVGWQRAVISFAVIAAMTVSYPLLLIGRHDALIALGAVTAAVIALVVWAGRRNDRPSRQPAPGSSGERSRG